LSGLYRLSPCLTRRSRTLPRLHALRSLTSLALLPFYAISSPPVRISGRPYTIPALKEWTDGTGVYTFGADSRIVLANALSVSLIEMAEVFARDLLLLTGLNVPIVVTDEISPGDIVLELAKTSPAPGNEGYQLIVADHAVVSAAYESGVFYGTCTLLQLLRQGFTIHCGIARDWPDYPERGLMVDAGRKYFSLSWLESHLRELAYLKYNYFHFHLSDTFGFRLESERHPEIVSPQHYTKAEIRHLLDLARQYHIVIVPEIDMPAHMNTILDAHPELRITSSTGVQRLGDIDLTQDAAYVLARDLLEEFLPLFPGPYWHLGADEYLMRDSYANYPQLQTFAQQRYGANACAKDAYLGFVNWANEIVKAHGKTARAWNDGLHGGKAVSVASDIIYEHWYKSALAPQEIIDLDLKIVNSNADMLYYVLGVKSWRAHANIIYETFEPHIFHDDAPIALLHPQNLGAKLHVWCDHPDVETESQIAAGIKGPLRALAQKNWGSPRLVSSYDSFVPVAEQIGRAPGYAVEP
jgi:hexosaminidase